MMLNAKRPIRIIQFGGGVFLRGFFDWMLQKANDASLMCADAYIVRSRTRGADPLAANGYRYTHVSRDGAHEEITPVDCIAGSMDASSDAEGFRTLALLDAIEVVVSNTTEAGIVYTPCPYPQADLPESYPAKLAYLLSLRCQSDLAAPLILPCELIEHGGDTLREIVLRHGRDWGLGDRFANYVTNECRFCNTLVDRIVSGRPQNAPEHDVTNESEYFHLFVIEGEEDARLPFAKLGLNVRWVKDVTPFRTIKVRILNGAHTSTIPMALLSHLATVGELMKDTAVRAHLEACLFEEIIPSLDVDQDEAISYARDVLSRFENPHLHHLCTAIAQNSVSKFRVRVLPSMLAYREKFGKNPPHLCRALGKLIALYHTEPPRDEPDTLKAMQASADDILRNTLLWGTDLHIFAEEVLPHAH